MALRDVSLHGAQIFDTNLATRPSVCGKGKAGSLRLNCELFKAERNGHREAEREDG